MHEPVLCPGSVPSLGVVWSAHISQVYCTLKCNLKIALYFGLIFWSPPFSQTCIPTFSVHVCILCLCLTGQTRAEEKQMVSQSVSCVLGISVFIPAAQLQNRPNAHPRSESNMFYGSAFEIQPGHFQECRNWHSLSPWFHSRHQLCDGSHLAANLLVSFYIRNYVIQSLMQSSRLPVQ